MPSAPVGRGRGRMACQWLWGSHLFHQAQRNLFTCPYLPKTHTHTHTHSRLPEGSLQQQQQKRRSSLWICFWNGRLNTDHLLSSRFLPLSVFFCKLWHKDSRLPHNSRLQIRYQHAPFHINDIGGGGEANYTNKVPSVATAFQEHKGINWRGAVHSDQPLFAAPTHASASTHRHTHRASHTHTHTHKPLLRAASQREKAILTPHEYYNELDLGH